MKSMFSLNHAGSFSSESTRDPLTLDKLESSWEKSPRWRTSREEWRTGEGRSRKANTQIMHFSKIDKFSRMQLNWRLQYAFAFGGIDLASRVAMYRTCNGGWYRYFGACESWNNYNAYETIIYLQSKPIFSERSLALCSLLSPAPGLEFLSKLQEWEINR
jgi:hypothetical protein